MSLCIERIRVATSLRRASFREALEFAGQDGSAFAGLPHQLASILDEYLTEEDKHVHSARDSTDGSGELKRELF